jgi:hypothetical protein
LQKELRVKHQTTAIKNNKDYNRRFGSRGDYTTEFLSKAKG